jgi:hypothetical protein
MMPDAPACQSRVCACVFRQVSLLPLCACVCAVMVGVSALWCMPYAREIRRRLSCICGRRRQPSMSVESMTGRCVYGVFCTFFLCSLLHPCLSMGFLITHTAPMYAHTCRRRHCRPSRTTRPAAWQLRCVPPFPATFSATRFRLPSMRASHARKPERRRVMGEGGGRQDGCVGPLLGGVPMCPPSECNVRPWSLCV